MLKKIALVTLTAAALVAPPSLAHALGGTNGHNLNGITLNGIHLNGIHLNGLYVNGIHLNGIHLNGLYVNGVSAYGLKVNGVEPAGREVYFVGEQAGSESSTVLTIELPQDDVTR